MHTQQVMVSNVSFHVSSRVSGLRTLENVLVSLSFFLFYISQKDLELVVTVNNVSFWTPLFGFSGPTKITPYTIKYTSAACAHLKATGQLRTESIILCQLLLRQVKIRFRTQFVHIRFQVIILHNKEQVTVKTSTLQGVKTQYIPISLPGEAMSSLSSDQNTSTTRKEFDILGYIFKLKRMRSYTFLHQVCQYYTSHHQK